MINRKKISIGLHTINDIDDIKDELTLNWKIVYDNTDEISYEDKLIALLSIEKNYIYNGFYIEQFEVLNAYKRKGYGTAIIEELLTEVDECYVLPQSNDAVKFWEKLGFRKEDEGVGEYVWHYVKTK